MLNFYADDANKTDQHEYIHVAAYVGLTAQWEERFTPDWRLRLAHAGLSAFHANPFFNGAPPFEGWNKKAHEGERSALLKDLVEIIGQNSLFSFITIVHVPSWTKLNREYCLEERRLRPYPLAARTITKLARVWWEKRGNNPNQIRYVFDQGFEDWGMLCDRLQTDLGFKPVPGDHREIRPLQAADWLAYESGKEAPQYYDEKNRKRRPRKSFLALLNIGRTQPTIFHEKDLLKLCKDPRAQIPKRGTQVIFGGKVTDTSELGKFNNVVDQVLAVPHEEIMRREKEYQELSAKNPKRRGPKRKVKPSASGHESRR
jgi:hypothetical protein